MYILSVILILCCYIGIYVQKTSTAKIELVDNVYKNIVVGISNTVDESSDLIHQIRKLFDNTSAVLKTTLEYV